MMKIVDLFEYERSAHKVRRFEFNELGNRRFMYDPSTRFFIFGEEDATHQMGSHAQEYANILGTNADFDRCVRGWVSHKVEGLTGPGDTWYGGPYEHGFIHFYRTNASQIFSCLQAFKRNGADANTNIYLSGDDKPKKLGSIINYDSNRAGGFVTEDAASDMSSLRKAEMIMTKFFRWVQTHNEEKPIKEIMSKALIPTAERAQVGYERYAYIVSALEIGLPKEYKDLWFAFESSDTVDSRQDASTKAYMHTSFVYGGGGLRYTAALVFDEPLGRIGNTTDLVWGISEDTRSSMVHELVHYFDSKRQKTSDRNAPLGISAPKTNNHTEHYNSPKEFNAYFQQGMHLVMKDLIVAREGKRKLSSFPEFRTFAWPFFKENFRDLMTPETKQRFDKRLYQLWEWLKEKYPNIADTGQLMPVTEKVVDNFRAWFGNSKITTPDGKPLRVYHGTGEDFHSFGHGKNSYGSSGSRESKLGFWFTDNTDTANSFAHWSSRGGYTPSNVIPVYLKMEKPWVAKSYEDIRDLVDRHTKWSDRRRLYRMFQDVVDYTAARKELTDQGYDGIILPDTLTDSPDAETRITQYVVFSPTQIKSAIGNNGAYHPEKENITEWSPSD